MKSLVSWLLGGALLASLSWNWQSYCDLKAADRERATAPGCAPGANCALDTACMGLEPTVREELSALCTDTCGESDQLERRADELQAQLLVALAAPQVDRAATARLIDEVTELRKRSLEECVEGILGVREVLGAEEVRALVERCSVQSDH
jgi:hypothetical protein